MFKLINSLTYDLERVPNKCQENYQAGDLIDFQRKIHPKSYEK